jgi:hypothetical protein
MIVIFFVNTCAPKMLYQKYSMIYNDAGLKIEMRRGHRGT